MSWSVWGSDDVCHGVSGGVTMCVIECLGSDDVCH